MSPTRHFCCCLPVRLGVFVLSLGSIIGSGAYAAVIWYAVYMSKTGNHASLDKPQEVAFVVAGSIYSFLFFLSILGFIGAITRRYSFVSAYAQALWYMVGFQLASGAFFIYTLYRQNDANIQKCITEVKADPVSQNLTPEEISRACQVATKAWKIGYIIVFIVTLLVHGYCALIVSRYVEQLANEQSYRHTHKSTSAAFSTPSAGAAYYPHHPLGQSTDNLTQHHDGKENYEFSAPNQSYGRSNV
ncbi:tetraspanin family protein [Ceratobasidium sp. AG-Ba]|nr:tetraspanin family protein [Ceratobasidium sp. AG-Ba]QRW09777.1 tetraspanin family protein [Ceratobasidium sp. AG-Ba]